MKMIKKVFNDVYKAIKLWSDIKTKLNFNEKLYANKKLKLTRDR